MESSEQILVLLWSLTTQVLKSQHDKNANFYIYLSIQQVVDQLTRLKRNNINLQQEYSFGT